MNYDKVNYLIKNRNKLVSNLMRCNRNKFVFDRGSGKLEDSFFEIQLRCFDWVTRKDKDMVLDWEGCLSDPFGI